MRVILLDDEMIILKILKELLSKIPSIEIVGVFQNTVEALSFLLENKADLAFVDINLKGESGLDFARKLSAYHIDIEVAFITAFKEHALEAFDVDAFDYIVKPITQERLERTIAKIHMKQYKYKKPEYCCSIYCLGNLDVHGENDEKIRWISTKSREVFFYLLQSPGKSVSRHFILEEIFNDMPTKNANTYLNTTIYQLKKALEPHGLKNMLLSNAETYSLDLKNVYVDVTDFQNRVSNIGEINDKNLSYALETEQLYKGYLFGDKSYIWGLPESERTFQLYSRFAKKLIKYLMENENYSMAAYITKKLVRFDELDEESNALLMQAYAAQKDKTSLTKLFERYASKLKKETGNIPSKYITNLYAELRKKFSANQIINNNY